MSKSNFRYRQKARSAPEVCISWSGESKIEDNKLGAFFKRLLLAWCLFFPHSYAMGQDSFPCEKAKLIIFNFINSKQISDWGIVEDNADKLQKCQCEMAPVFYYIYRMHMLLPNSHALQGISPNDYQLSQKLKMNEQVIILKNCEIKSYSPLINSMMKQNFDVDLSKSAIDLESQLV